jgi:hypothetical protein
MKKLFFIAIAATGMLFACNSNDSNDSTDSVNATDDVTVTSDSTPVATEPVDTLTAPELVPEEPKL